MPPREPVISNQFWRGMIIVLVLPAFYQLVSTAVKLNAHDLAIADVRKSDEELLRSRDEMLSRITELKRQDELTANSIQTNMWMLEKVLTDRVDAMQRADVNRFELLQRQLAQYSDLLNQLQATLSHIKQTVPPGM